MNTTIRYFFPKLGNRIPGYIARMCEHLPVEKLSTVGLDFISGKAALTERLQHILGKQTDEIIKGANDKEKDAILSHANEAKQHIFNVLGSGPYRMEEINWSLEIKTGFEWPVGVYYNKIRNLTPEGSDIKIPWEISRCHHLLWMAEAYCLTEDESYAEEVIKQIRHWICHNPLMYSVNWTCAMDVAIRAVNWMYSLAIIGSSNFFTDEFAKDVYHSLYQHLFFINLNLEKCVPYSNNHYFSDIIGQLFLGKLFSKTLYGRYTFKHAVKEFFHEIQLQILPSGVDYERSISYHRLMTELVMYGFYMLDRVGIVIPYIVSERFSRMLGFINEYTMPNGDSPLVSDNDDGRLLPIVPTPFMQHKYLVTPNSLDSRIASASCTLIVPAYSDNKSCIHSDANLVILKRENLYLFTSCFSRWRHDRLTDKFISTHLHNDLLSFVLADGDIPIITDAGAYCYTSDTATWKSFRTTKKHNTIMVDNEEQNLLGDSAFIMKYNTNAMNMLFLSGETEHCEGEYTTIVGHMTHHRDFDLGSQYLKITDCLIKEGNGHKAYMSFHFGKGITPMIEGNIVRLSYADQHYIINFSDIFSLNLRIIDDTFSPSFGVLEKSRTLVVEFEFDESAECVTVIEKI